MAHIEYPSAVIKAAQELGVELGSGEDYDPSEALETLGAELQLQVQAHIHGDLTPVRWGDNPDDPFAYEDLAEYSDFGFSLKKLSRGIKKAARGVVKVAGKVVNNPIVGLALPMVPAAIGKGPMVELGKKFAPAPIAKALSVGQKAITGGLKTVGKLTGVSAAKKPAVAHLPASPVSKITAQAINSAIKKTVTPAGIVSFGVPSTGNVKAAMSQADRLLGDPKVNNAALVVRNTKALAALGDPSAKRGLSVLNAVATIRVAKKTVPGKAAVPQLKIKTPVVQKTTPAKITALVKTTAVKKTIDTKKQTWVQKVLGWFGLQVKTS